MPRVAFLNAPVNCPSCGAIIRDETEFAWGLCGPVGPSWGFDYRLGESIRWRKHGGTEPPTTFFQNRALHQTVVNAGDPLLRHVDVGDPDFDFESDLCRWCGREIATVRVQIRDGLVTSVVALEDAIHWGVIDMTDPRAPKPRMDLEEASYRFVEVNCVLHEVGVPFGLRD